MRPNLSRRGLVGMLAAGIGAAIVRPGLLMPVKPRLLTVNEIIQQAYEGIGNLPLFGTINFASYPEASLLINGKIYEAFRVPTQQVRA